MIHLFDKYIIYGRQLFGIFSDCTFYKWHECKDTLLAHVAHFFFFISGTSEQIFTCKFDVFKFCKIRYIEISVLVGYSDLCFIARLYIDAIFFKDFQIKSCQTIQIAIDIAAVHGHNGKT